MTEMPTSNLVTHLVYVPFTMTYDTTGFLWEMVKTQPHDVCEQQEIESIHKVVAEHLPAMNKGAHDMFVGIPNKEGHDG